MLILSTSLSNMPTCSEWHGRWPAGRAASSYPNTVFPDLLHPQVVSAAAGDRRRTPCPHLWRRSLCRRTLHRARRMPHGPRRSRRAVSRDMPHGLLPFAWPDQTDSHAASAPPFPSMSASSMRRLAPPNSTRRPRCTTRSIRAAASLSSPSTVPHFPNSMLVVKITLRLS